MICAFARTARIALELATLHPVFRGADKDQVSTLYHQMAELEASLAHASHVRIYISVRVPTRFAVSGLHW